MPHRPQRFTPFEAVNLHGSSEVRMVRRISARRKTGDIPPTRRPMEFHRMLPGYAATPLVRLSGLAKELGLSDLSVKDESRRLGLRSFKILGASWAVYRALSGRLGREPRRASTVDDLAEAFAPLRPLTFVAATDGNHGQAVAHISRLLGFPSRILVPADLARARIKAIEDEGALVDTIDGSYDLAVERAAAMQDDQTIVIADTAWASDGQVPTWISDGYSTIFWEIDDALHDRGEPPPDLVVVQIGVGALARSVVAHYRRPGMPVEPTIVGVEPITAACALETAAAGQSTYVAGPHRSVMAGLNAGRVSPVAIPALAHGIDAYLAIPDRSAQQAVRLLAKHQISAGDTGAAGLAALIACPPAIRLVSRTPAPRTLVLVTEAATDPVS